jgi:hypothetical protein
LALLLGPGNRHDRVHAVATVDAVPSLRVRRRGRENRPSTLLADRGYDADWFRDSLRERGITPLIRANESPEPVAAAMPKPGSAGRLNEQTPGCTTSGD